MPSRSQLIGSAVSLNVESKLNLHHVIQTAFAALMIQVSRRDTCPSLQSLIRPRQTSTSFLTLQSTAVAMTQTSFVQPLNVAAITRLMAPQSEQTAHWLQQQHQAMPSTWPSTSVRPPALQAPQQTTPLPKTAQPQTY